MKTNRGKLCLSGFFFLLFLLWTIALQFVDVLPIGPNGSQVGFASLNGFFHGLTGVHMMVYTITDWLGFVPIIFALGFAMLGLSQLIKRKSLCKVDADILILGGFYIIVMAAYSFFEVFAINFRPVLINGNLEASYPSSTTLLVLCVMPTAIMQLRQRMKPSNAKRAVEYMLAGFTVLMVLGRLLSGVHWLSDIVGGMLLSESLVLMYASIINWSKGIRRA